MADEMYKNAVDVGAKNFARDRKCVWKRCKMTVKKWKSRGKKPFLGSEKWWAADKLASQFGAKCRFLRQKSEEDETHWGAKTCFLCGFAPPFSLKGLWLGGMFCKEKKSNLTNWGRVNSRLKVGLKIALGVLVISGKVDAYVQTTSIVIPNRTNG